MKRILTGVLPVIALLGLVSCGDSDTETKKSAPVVGDPAVTTPNSSPDGHDGAEYGTEETGSSPRQEWKED